LRSSSTSSSEAPFATLIEETLALIPTSPFSGDLSDARRDARI